MKLSLRSLHAAADFALPPAFTCSSNGFMWMVDNKGKLWVQHKNDKLLTGDDQEKLVEEIQRRHPFVDVKAVLMGIKYI